ncbi:MAG TPA: HTH domain-containing protein [Microbacteriaceae bacterium]|nr:HTH domain-containing protein [Microbacteriaceae bacterium]
MPVEAFNVESELRRIVAEGRISEESLQTITGIPGDVIASLLSDAREREPGLSAPPSKLSPDQIGRLSALVDQLTEGLQIDDDTRLKAIIQTLTEQFRMTHQHIALLTGIDLNDLKSALYDPDTAKAERKYELAIRASYLMNAIGNAAPTQ